MSTTEETIDNTEVVSVQESQPESGPITAEPAPAKKRVSGEVKLFAAILVGAIILGGAAIWPTMAPGPKRYTPPPPKKVELKREMLMPAGSHIKGDPNAKYSLVEFSDFQCPSCMKSVAEIEQLLKQHKGKLNVVFRHYQAARAHVHSRDLGLAAEAAGLQGKFFEMGGKLFESQHDYEAASPEDVQEIVLKAAKELGLNVERFKKDLVSTQVAARYDADIAAAETAHIESTPCYVFVPPTGQPTVIAGTPEMLTWLKDPKNFK